jgi:hypothetical protein
MTDEESHPAMEPSRMIYLFHNFNNINLIGLAVSAPTTLKEVYWVATVARKRT